MLNEPETKLSASRIKTAQSCSWLYHCKYKLRLPDKGNDGSSRGTVCHAILEVLAKEGRKDYYQTIIDSNDIFAVPSVGRLALTLAKSLGVDDQENLDFINFMTVNGLTYDYFGHDLEKPTYSFSEKKFDIMVNHESKCYRINGFIDKLFLYKKKKAAIIRDFKTSKSVFEGKDATDNMQDLMYSLAVKHLYPDYPSRQSEFLFLKFDLNSNLLGEDGEGVLKMSSLSDDELEGFEHQLTAWQTYLDKFDNDSAYDDFAFDRGFPAKDAGFSDRLMCGFAKHPGQLKKDGNPMWHCTYKFPFKYYALKNEKGTTKKTVFEEDKDLLLPLKEEGDIIILEEYEGCPRHQPSISPEGQDPFSL
jgi:hypothetical protein